MTTKVRQVSLTRYSLGQTNFVPNRKFNLINVTCFVENNSFCNDYLVYLSSNIHPKPEDIVNIIQLNLIEFNKFSSEKESLVCTDSSPFSSNCYTNV